MAFRDQLLRCAACGSEFVYTVREQRMRVEMGLPPDPPAFCPDCRGADVRLAEAAMPSLPSTRDNGPVDRPRSRPDQSRPPRFDRGERPPAGAGHGERDRQAFDGPGGGRFNRDRGPGRGGPPGRGRGPRGGGRPPRERQTELRIRHVGTVKWFNTQKGYGFIAAEEGDEVFVHMSSVLDERLRALEIGTPVEFEIEHSGRGPQAVDVIPLA